MATGYVRPARSGDAAEIARIQLTTWRTAYRRLLPRQVLDDLDEAWTTRRWLDAIVAPPTSRHRVLAAVERPERPPAGTTGVTVAAAREAVPAYLVGFAAIGPADEAALAPGEHPGDLGPGCAAVTELLVEPRWRRRGHGSRLLSACADLLRVDGFTTAVAWTFADDPVMRRFLDGAGWAPDGASRALDVDDLLVPQIRLHTSITGDSERTGVIRT